MEYDIIMKARLDFVSNSSSSSFVVACQMQHLNAVAKDLARACCNTRDRYHDKSLAEKNKRVLDFCLHTFQLAFLGELLISTKKETYGLDFFKKMLKQATLEVAEAAWERYKRDLQKVKDGTALKESFIAREYCDDVYDPVTDTAEHFEKTYASEVVVSNDVMTYNLHHINPSPAPEPENIRQSRVNRLLAMANAKHEYEFKKEHYRAIEPVEVYQVTRDTIANTRDLIAAGYEVRLEKWQDLDALDARLENGDAMFYVRIANSGDGYGDFYIYCEDGADGLDGVSGIEILASECM